MCAILGMWYNTHICELRLDGEQENVRSVSTSLDMVYESCNINNLYLSNIGIANEWNKKK